MTSWNYADVFEAVADGPPRRRRGPPGRRRRPRYGELLARVDALGQRAPRARCASSRTRSASTSTTAPSTSIATMAALHARLVPVNTNYRYGDDELAYLWDNADCVAVVFHGDLHRPRRSGCGHAAAGCARGSTSTTAPTPCPSWAIPTRRPAQPRARATRRERSGDDLILLYTGGTTGMPKGVMWPQDDLFRRLNAARARAATTTTRTLDDVAARRRGGRRLARSSPACPLMHGTGLFSALEYALSRAAPWSLLAVATLRRRRARRHDRAPRAPSSPSSSATRSPGRCSTRCARAGAPSASRR